MTLTDIRKEDCIGNLRQLDEAGVDRYIELRDRDTVYPLTMSVGSKLLRMIGTLDPGKCWTFQSECIPAMAVGGRAVLWAARCAVSLGGLRAKARTGQRHAAAHLSRGLAGASGLRLQPLRGAVPLRPADGALLWPCSSLSTY